MSAVFACSLLGMIAAVPAHSGRDCGRKRASWRKAAACRTSASASKASSAGTAIASGMSTCLLRDRGSAHIWIAATVGLRQAGKALRGCLVSFEAIWAAAWLGEIPARDTTILRDIDFTSAGIHARWQAGYADTMRTVERRPWDDADRPDDGRCGPRSRSGDCARSAIVDPGSDEALTRAMPDPVFRQHRGNRLDERSVAASRSDRRRRRGRASPRFAPRRLARPPPQGLDHASRQIAHPRLEAAAARGRIRIAGQRNGFARTDRACARPALSLPHRRDGRAQSRQAAGPCRAEPRRGRPDRHSAARARLRHAGHRGRQPVQRFRHSRRRASMPSRSIRSIRPRDSTAA